jgi:hypothetical protein
MIIIIVTPVETSNLTYDKELYELLEELEIWTVIWPERLRWAGHVMRMDEKEIPKIIQISRATEQNLVGDKKWGVLMM